MCLKAPKMPSPPPIPQAEDAMSARLKELRLRGNAKGPYANLSQGSLLGVAGGDTGASGPKKTLLGAA